MNFYSILDLIIPFSFIEEVNVFGEVSKNSCDIVNNNREFVSRVKVEKEKLRKCCLLKNKIEKFPKNKDEKIFKSIFMGFFEQVKELEIQQLRRKWLNIVRVLLDNRERKSAKEVKMQIGLPENLHVIYPPELQCFGGNNKKFPKNSLKRLPDELLCEILLYFVDKIRDLCKIRTVSRFFQKFIRDYKFFGGIIWKRIKFPYLYSKVKEKYKINVSAISDYVNFRKLFRGMKVCHFPKCTFEFTEKEVLDSFKEGIILPLKFPELFTGLRRPWCTFWLFGPKGNGELELLRSLVGSLGCLLFQISLKKLLKEEKPEMALKYCLFATTVVTPSFVLFDDIDYFNTLLNGSHPMGMRRGIYTRLIIYFGDTSKVKDLYVFVRSSKMVSPMMRRKLSKRIFFNLTRSEERLRILQKYLRDEKELDQLLVLTDHYTRSKLKCICGELNKGRKIEDVLKTFEAISEEEISKMEEIKEQFM